jgi:hypothetical protein
VGEVSVVTSSFFDVRISSVVSFTGFSVGNSRMIAMIWPVPAGSDLKFDQSV